MKDDDRETDRDLRTIARLQDRIAGLHGVLAAAYSIIRGHGTIGGSLTHQMTQLDTIIHLAMQGEGMRVDSKMTHKIREQFRGEEFMIAAEVGRTYNLARSWLARKLRAGEGPAFILVGARRHFQRKDVDTWLAALKRKGKITSPFSPGNPETLKYARSKRKIIP